MPKRATLQRLANTAREHSGSTNRSSAACSASRRKRPHGISGRGRRRTRHCNPLRRAKLTATDPCCKGVYNLPAVCEYSRFSKKCPTSIYNYPYNSRKGRKLASGMRRRSSGLAPAGVAFGNSASYHFRAAAGRRPSESTDGRPPISMARGGGSRPRAAPRIPPRAPPATSPDTWRAFPPKKSGPTTRPRRGLPRAAQAAGTGYFFASVSGLPHPTGPARSHDPCAFKNISGAFESRAVRERQVARPRRRFEAQGCAANGTADSPIVWRAAASTIMYE